MASTRLPGVSGLRLAGLVFITGCLAACAARTPFEPADNAPPRPRDVSGVPNAVPQPEALSRYGNPDSYVVFGKRYHTLRTGKGYQARGLASWYGTKFHGKRTSSGEPYDLYAMTAAHKTLPLPTYVEVTNLDNGRRVIVKVNDRGPFHEDRLIDLSYTAAVKLDILARGTGRVEVRAIDPGQAASTANPATAPGHAATDAAAVYLQVGAFQERSNADRLQRQIQARAIGTVSIDQTADSPLYKVLVGPLSGTAEAEQVMRALKPLGISESRSIIQ